MVQDTGNNSTVEVVKSYRKIVTINTERNDDLLQRLITRGDKGCFLSNCGSCLQLLFPVWNWVPFSFYCTCLACLSYIYMFYTHSFGSRSLRPVVVSFLTKVSESGPDHVELLQITLQGARERMDLRWQRGWVSVSSPPGALWTAPRMIPRQTDARTSVFRPTSRM